MKPRKRSRHALLSQGEPPPTAELEGELPPGPRSIDRAKLRRALRSMDREELLRMLVRATDCIPDERLVEVCERHIELRKILAEPGAPRTLLEEVQTFHAASLSGDYYEEFRVDSHNYMSLSKGTQNWIIEFEVLLERALAFAREASPEETLAVLDPLIDLLSRIEEGEEILFFAKRGGVSEMCIDWKAVFPTWLRALSATVDPEAYARRAMKMVDVFFHSYERLKYVEYVRVCGTRADPTGVRQSDAPLGKGTPRS